MFIKRYADVHAVPLPGRLPKHQDYRVMKLPSDVTKASVYREFILAREAEASNTRILSYRQFCRLWQELVPFVTTMMPSTDLCFTCQENVASIMRSANLPEDMKSEKLKAAEEHLKIAKSERAAYNEKKEASRKAWNDLPRRLQVHGNPYCSSPITALYSFDHAQLVHLPSNPMQPGPIYFKTARKCEIFGICCEGSRVQTNYLIDEAESIGKGANSIISYVHHYLENHGLGEQHLELQADNCVGQNKNNFVMQYLVWRCLTGHHLSCSIHFMIPGHTRFSPDQYFGLIKRKFRKTPVSSIVQLRDVVLNSSESGLNQVQLAYNPADGSQVVCYDWKEFLSKYFQRIPNILRYHHFATSSEDPGTMSLKETPSSRAITFNMLKSNVEVSPDSMPNVIVPTGMSPDRQMY